ncbi:recombination regulator RecX [Oceanobacillus sp. CAU 1775]
MKKISKITTQKKNTNRYNIFFAEKNSDAYAFSVDEAILIEFHLRKGLELDDKTIEAINQRDNLYKSYTRAIHYLSYRMRSRKEVYDYLVKKEVSHEFIEEILERLTNEKLLNDHEFANMFVRTRINTSTKGPKIIANELREKGITQTIIEDVLLQFTYEMQFDKVYKLMDKKLKQPSKHSFRKRIQQLQMSLVQKGYAQDVIKEVTAEFADTKDDSEEWEALNFQGEKLLKKHSVKLEGFELRNKIKEGLHQRGFRFELIQKFVEERVKR